MKTRLAGGLAAVPVLLIAATLVAPSSGPQKEVRVPATDFSSTVWGAAGLVLLALLALSFVLSRWLRGRGLAFWCLTGLVLLTSGPVVRYLVDLWTAGPTHRVVPGAAATWAPAAIALLASLLLWMKRRKASFRPSA